MTDPIPFTVRFDDADIADLRDRLRKTRFPERETVEDWSQGVPLAFAQDLSTYWERDYDFSAAEERLNAWPQFKTRIDDLDIHFLHTESAVTTALPLVLTHGWPGTAYEFAQIIGPLTDPVAFGGDDADAFHVVCPSLPGYGFSARPTTRGRGLAWIGDAWATLMDRLGYERFAAQGGDWGSAVTCVLANAYPHRVVGIHLNMPTIALAPLPDDPTEAEQQSLADFEWHTRWGSGYQKQQSTRPQTLGYGLVDSPVAQLAWVVEKFWAWTDCGGNPLDLFTREQLLDIVSVYWFSATGASSGRLYWESAGPALWEDPAAAVALSGPVNTPTAVSMFPKELRRPSRRQAAERFTNIYRWNEVDRGGHFAAFEQPDLFVDEIRASFREVR